MGVLCRIDLCFNQNLQLKTVAKHLVARGWCFGFDGRLRCWQADSDRDEWSELPLEALPEVLAAYESHRGDLSLCMYHVDEGAEVLPVSLAFDDSDPCCLAVDCSWGRRLSSWHSAAFDFSWYLQRLLPDPETSNLQIVDINIHAQHT